MTDLKQGTTPQGVTNKHAKANGLATELEQLQAKYNALCDEQESLNRTGFAEVFEILDELIEDFTPQHPYTDDEATINLALSKAGKADDEAFCKAFKRNNQIMIEGKAIQASILEALPQPRQGVALKMIEGANITDLQIKNANVTESGDWQFCPPMVIAPEQLIREVDKVMLEDAKQGKGLWANITNVPDEDEAEDEFLMIEAYGLKCSLTPFVEALKRYNVVGGANAFLDNDCKRLLLAVVKGEATFAKDNTQTPAKIKNHIKKTLQGFDEWPVYGLFFQMLTLQGLCQWLEGVNINEGDEGYNEAKSLYNWLFEVLATKMIMFCYMPYGTTDLTTLQPLCNYLASTPVGQLVQQHIKEQPEQVPEASTETQDEARTLPNELATDEAKALLEKAKAAGFLDEAYKWKGTQQLAAYFAYRASQSLNLSSKQDSQGNITTCWKPFETLFGYETGKRVLSTAKANWMRVYTRFEPTGFEQIDTLFTT